MCSKASNFDIFFPLSQNVSGWRLNLKKCFICQTEKKNVPLRKAKSSSMDTLKSALELRKDDVYTRLWNELDYDNIDDAPTILWHSVCYSPYTSQENIRRATKSQSKVESIEPSTVVPRSSQSSSNLLIDKMECFICQKKTHKKCHKLYNVSSFESCKSVKQAAFEKGNKGVMNIRVLINDDLMAAEAKYHKVCFDSYVSKSNLKHKGFKESDGETFYDAAFKEMADK